MIRIRHAIAVPVTDFDRSLLDPFKPLLNRGKPIFGRVDSSRQMQRLRRSEILAAVRRLLADGGCENITVRRISTASGYAVQTIYNLIGSRHDAIIEAISEYSFFVGRNSRVIPDSPTAILGIVDQWIQSIQSVPQFCQQVNKIYFTQSRGIYYKFRDRQLEGMRSLLRRQQERGIIREVVDTDGVAEDLALFSSTLMIEWSDRPFPIQRLHSRLRSGCASLLADKVHEEFRADLLMPEAT